MTWQVKPTITVAGIGYTNITFNQVSIDYGRSKIFDTPRPGYARVEIANLTNTAFPFKVNDSLVIELENASAADITVFTGIVTDVKGSFRNSDASSGLGIITLTAVAPMAQMSRIVVGQSAYPAESDADRISRIFTEAGITVDVVDPAIYNFVARPASLTDAFSLSNNYANSVLGAIYETTDGKVGYANESRRLVEVNTNGYVSIPNSSIIINSISSHENIADVMNLANVTYSGGTVSDFDTASQSTYGLIGATFNTEISNAFDAETIAATYINLRSIPRKNLSTFQVRLYDPTLSNSEINDLLAVYFGMPITVPGLPNAIVDADYYGYVEGWNLSFSPAAAVVTLKTSEEAYSYRDLRWQDVDPNAEWDDLDPTALKNTRTNLVKNPSMEVNTTGLGTVGNVTFSRITTDSKFGIACGQIVNTTTGNNNGITITRNATYAIPCTPGSTYTGSVYVRRTVGSRSLNIRLQTRLSATSGTLVEAFTSSSVSSNNWTEIKLSATPTDPTGLFIELFVRNATSGAIGDTFLADGLLVVNESTNSFYFDGTTTDIPASRRPELAWTGTADNSTSTAEAYFGTIPDTTWDNVDQQGIP
jgi:hypothetical protein